jgi:hypothetical protein
MSQGNRMAEYLRVLLIIRIPQESRSFPKVKHVFEQAFERRQSPLANLHPTCRPPPPFPGQVVKTPHRQSTQRPALTNIQARNVFSNSLF